MAIQNEHRLRELLQIDPDASVPDGDGPEYWHQTLERLGRATGIDPEAGEYPVDHTFLVEDILPLASPLLDGAAFEQELPSDDADGQEDGLYTLHLTHGGRQYTVHFEDTSDSFNVNAVLALLNAALGALGSPLRYFHLGDTIIVGPLAGVQQAMREGFITGLDEELDREELARQLEMGRLRVQVFAAD
jgi:hypothetical protein